ncbi:YhcH/YjgK/YiaL family protein [Helicobacter himalayensis]|uniref:YhcH/YjgK/YiaL family protein n=1 Tax=Helicobacter himalayensis TaxID=1591088 RepID=UPI003D7020CC
MALIGHLSQFEGFFARYPTLENVVAYLQECMKSSPVRSRILALGTQGDIFNSVAESTDSKQLKNTEYVRGAEPSGIHFREGDTINGIEAEPKRVSLPQGDITNGIAFGQNFRIEMRYDLGNGISAIEQTYALKSPKEAFFETHRKYVDLQFCVDGSEYMLIGHRGDFEVLETYDESKDLIVYKNPLANCAFEPYSADFPIHRISLHAGILAVFFPDDVHAGGLDSVNSKLNNPKKSVLKVPVELFH